MDTKKTLLAFGEPLDIMELMEVKGGSSEGDIVCNGSPAISCNGTPALVICNGTEAIGTKPLKPKPDSGKNP